MWPQWIINMVTIPMYITLFINGCYVNIYATLIWPVILINILHVFPPFQIRKSKNFGNWIFTPDVSINNLYDWKNVNTSELQFFSHKAGIMIIEEIAVRLRKQ